MEPPREFYPLIRPIFDWTEGQSNKHFPQAPTVLDINSLLEKVLEEHAANLRPDQVSRDEVMTHLKKVCTVVDNLILSGDGDEMLLDEVLLVGAHKMNIARSSDRTGEVVIILKDLPTPALASKISTCLLECLEQRGTKNAEKMNLSFKSDTCFEIGNARDAAALIYLTSVGEIVFDGPRRHRMITNLTPFEEALRLVRRSRWWEDQTMSLNSACDLVRVLLDMRSYVPGLRHFSAWDIQLLSHCAMVPLGAAKALSLAGGFRRVWELLSAGLFLPGSSGLPDPCEAGEQAIHEGIPPHNLDELAMNAQMILQLISFGAYKELLAMGGTKPINFQEPYTFGGVTIDVPEPAFSQEEI